MMTRFIIYMLLVVIIFLSGIVIGINRHSEEVIVEEEIEIQEDLTIYTSDEGDHHLATQKFASFLEKVTASFYELVVLVMYKFAKLFTS